MQESWCFHLSLNVASLPRAVAFYRNLFGMEPAKCHEDYAKFELTDPPVVFSLVPHAGGGPRSQVGLALGTAEQMQDFRERLANQGMHLDNIREGAFSIKDPDGNTWQFSSGPENRAWAELPAADERAAVSQEDSPTVWEHYVTAEAPLRIPHDDSSLDEVRLTGTFNAAHAEAASLRLVADALRVLKPGGKIVVHGLASDKPFPGALPKLSGLAALVSRIPTHHVIEEALHQAGFVLVQFTKFGDKAWFEHDGVQMREIKAVGFKKLAPVAESLEVIYRGPFREIRDDQGHCFVRGQRTAIPAAAWSQLRQSPQADRFVFVEPAADKKTCQIH